MWFSKKRVAPTFPKIKADPEDVREKLVEFVVARSVASESDLGPGVRLFSSGIMGSMDLVQLVLYIEKEFGVRPGEFMRVSPEAFDSLDDVARMISARS